jgi:hypothetical protein
MPDTGDTSVSARAGVDAGEVQPAQHPAADLPAAYALGVHGDGGPADPARGPPYPSSPRDSFVQPVFAPWQTTISV